MSNYEKLNYLMEITNSSNREIAAALHFSDSYISKIRNGTRRIKNIEAYHLIATFLPKSLWWNLFL